RPTAPLVCSSTSSTRTAGTASRAWATATTSASRPSTFFFQAEDGIRAATVTGVQTCALPICTPSAPERQYGRPGPRTSGAGRVRSEERRVGKECRDRAAADHVKETGRRYKGTQLRQVQGKVDSQ